MRNIDKFPGSGRNQDYGDHYISRSRDGKEGPRLFSGRFSGRVLKTGEHIVPEPALEWLADHNITFTAKKRRLPQEPAVDEGIQEPLEGQVGPIGIVDGELSHRGRIVSSNRLADVAEIPR